MVCLCLPSWVVTMAVFFRVILMIMSEPKHTYAIKLGGDVYNVKVENGKRYILESGTWFEVGEFVNMLYDDGEFEKLAGLVALGSRVKNG